MRMKKDRKRQKRNRDFFFVCKHIRFAWGLIILSAVVGCIQSVVVSMVPDATANLFDGDFSPDKLWGVAQTLLISLVLGLISYTVRIFAESKSVLSARTSVWEKMLNARMEYYDENDAASRLSMVTVDAQTFGSGLVQLFVYIPTMVVLMLACLVQLLGYSTKLLAVFIVLIPMHLIYFVFVGRWQQKLGKEYAGQIGDLTGYLAERVRNLPLIKSFAAEEKELQNGVQAAGRLFNITKKLNVYVASINAAYQHAAPALSNIVAVLWGCYLLQTGQTDITSFLAFSMYIVSINTTILVVATVWVFIKDFHGRANRIARLIESPTEAQGKKNTGKTEIPLGDIQIQNVSFRYPGGVKDSLENVDFTIPAGKVTAIVGPSGSGKTTLIKLLERLYEPTAGSIVIDGEDVGAFDLDSWRKSFSYVIQDAGVFSGTMREALCYSVDRNVNDDELIEVTRKVGLYEFINQLPEKFDTALASWGASLSGGQRQRIVIARAMLRNADVLIFDEPTSALDPETANTISQIILNGFTGKTVIIISHELNYIAHADKIVVLDQGKLLGADSHEQLMETCGTYRDLVRQQSYQEVFSV